MKKILSLIFIFLFIFLIGCSKDETEPQLFNYNLSLRVPKGAVISNEYKSFDNTSPYYDEYNIKSKSEEDVITIKVEGEYFEPFEVSVNPDIQSLDCRSMAELKSGEEKKIINSAATYIMGLYYGAQNGEKDIPLDSYIYSLIPLENLEKLEEYYNTIASSFSSFDPNGNLISYGIYDLMFNDFFGNVIKNEEGIYTANITLSYSYIYKQPDTEDKEVFNDITIGVDLTNENGKWVVIDIENSLILWIRSYKTQNWVL